MATEHACPHMGVIYDLYDSEFLCGDAGQLCPMCREDSADARTDRLVEGLVLAGLLASMETLRSQSGEPLVESDFATQAKYLAAALREREGG